MDPQVLLRRKSILQFIQQIKKLKTLKVCRLHFSYDVPDCNGAESTTVTNRSNCSDDLNISLCHN